MLERLPVPGEAQPISELLSADVFAALETRPEGLGQAEVQQRLKRYGLNRIERLSTEPLYKSFLANFTHLMALLLWAAGVAAFASEMPQLGIAIWMVNIINGGFSFWQEYRAEKATEALLELMPAAAHVLRDGKEIRLAAEQLVPGDLLVLNEGDRISADCRLVSAFSLSVDESILSGESRPVRKSSEALKNSSARHSALTNLAFAGTNVATGRGQAVVYATGMQTRFGQIAHLTQSVIEEPSPLQKEMERLTRTVTMLAVGIGLSFFVLAISVGHVRLAEGFVFAMGMIVAFVPEGMLPTVSLSLALGVQRMAKRNALVKRLSAVETLGCTTVVCSDKTGTITQNKMTLQRIWTADAECELTGEGYEPYGEIVMANQLYPAQASVIIKKVLLIGMRCNNGRLVPPHADALLWRIVGDPTEGALLVAARKAGIRPDSEEFEAHRICEMPFDSHRRRMSTLYDVHGVRMLYLKGSATEVLSRCTRMMRVDGLRRMRDTDRTAIMQANDNLAREGLRVLALAERVVPSDVRELTPDKLECELTFCGLAAMMDPPHDGVAEAVSKCHQAGIKVVMITGDYGLTAETIARKVGIISNTTSVITGEELENLNDTELCSRLSSPVIFARVMPEHKLRIVSTLQSMGHVVAVTGDGVNDAPALRKADIGIAMGIAGSDVAKESADMILTDDNFASIINAIELGRAVYANIRKFATYVFNSNMAEAVPFVVTLFSRGAVPLPLNIMQILSIDLGTDMVPALALGAESAEPGVMSRPPRNRQEPLLNKQLLCRALLWYGVIEAIAGMACYFYFNWMHGWPAQALAAGGTHEYRMATTMTLTGIVVTQVGAVLCCRTERASLFTIGLFSNRLILLGIAVELLLLVALIYLPCLQATFHTAPLGFREWAFALMFAPAVLLLDEGRKLYTRMRAPLRR